LATHPKSVKPINTALRSSTAAANDKRNKFSTEGRLLDRPVLNEADSSGIHDKGCNRIKCA